MCQLDSMNWRNASCTPGALGSAEKPDDLCYNKMKSVLSLKVNLLLKLSLSESILITVFASWILCVASLVVSTFPRAEDFWQKPDAIVRCSQQFKVKALFLEGFFLRQTLFLWFLTHNSTVLRLGTLSFRWKLKCRRNNRRVTTESLFQKYVWTAKARCSTDQRSTATEMLWVSLEGRSRTNSPRQRFHSQLCCRIVRYFCRSLYKKI